MACRIWFQIQLKVCQIKVLVVAVSLSSLDFGLVILNNEVVVELFSLLPKSEGVADFEVLADPNRKEGTGGLSSLSESDKFLFFLGASCEGTGLEPNKPVWHFG